MGSKNTSAAVAKTKHTVLMTEGSIFKNLLLFAIPLILGTLLQQMCWPPLAPVPL